MKKDFTGVIIKESLEDKKVLGQVKVLKTKVESVVTRHKTPWLKQWTLQTVQIPEDRAKEVAGLISKSLDSEHSWYADFKNDSHHYIIYRDKIFYINITGQTEYDRAKAYGLSLGIPDYQINFKAEAKGE